MADELVVPGPRAGRKQKGGNATDPDSLQQSTACRRLAKELRERMNAMLEGDALVFANRRRGTQIDSADYEKAYDDIVNPIPHPSRLGTVADLCNLAAGIFLGYAVNVLTNERPDYTRIGIAGLAGVFLGGVTVALKNLKLAR